MEFCKKCGNLLLIEKRRKHTFLVCRKCGTATRIKGKLKIAETIVQPKKEVIVMKKEEGIAGFPKTKIVCPSCGHGEAYWWMQQTRGADEPPTLFYRCVKCNYGWRSYG